MEDTRRVKTVLLVAAMAAGLLCQGRLMAGDWPRWRGPGSNGSAGDSGVPLADSWNDVKIAWVSEVKSPQPWNFSVVRGKTQWPRTVLGNGGYCMPAVWDGKVYVSYWRPAGEALATKGDGKYETMWATSGLRALQLIDADQVIVCMSARTGATLWQAVFEGTELNQVEAYGGHNNVCIADGKVYAIGNSGRAYCVEASSGAKLWSAKLGASADVWDTFKAQCVKDGLKSYTPPLDLVKALPPHPLGGSLHQYTYNVCPVVADGVMVTGDWSAGSVLIGLDGRTGRELWRRPGVVGNISTPLLWRHEGRQYVVVAHGLLRCIEPRTGKVLWSAGPVPHNAMQVGIDGDRLVCHGAAARGAGQEQAQPGWVCFKLRPDGADRIWSLGPAYLGATYLAPVIHRGYAWLCFRRGADAQGLTDCDTVGGRGAFVCVEMATGKPVSEIGDIPVNAVCPGPLAMGDRMFWQGDSGLWMMDLQPKAPRFLGVAAEPSNYCSSATAADGFVYFRSAERLVTCLDVRKPSRRPKAAARHDDPANAFYELSLAGARPDGKDVLFCFRGRGGKFDQSWAQSLVPGCRYPDVLAAEALAVAGRRLTGRAEAVLDAATCDYVLDVALGADGTAGGTYQDAYRGQAVSGEAKGTMLAAAGRNGTFRVFWPRHWWGGQNQDHEHVMTAAMAGGKFTSVTFGPRKGFFGKPHRNAWTAEVLRHELAFDGRRLTGWLTLRASGDIQAGTYRLTFEVVAVNNLLRGRVTSQREGRPATTHVVTGSVEVPASEPVAPRDGVFAVDLPTAVQGKTNLRLYFSATGGTVLSDSVASASGCGGLHPSDVSGISVEGNRVKGKAGVAIRADGYYLRADSVNGYDLDLRVEGNKVTGNYRGTYDVREPRKGKVSGTWANDG